MFLRLIKASLFKNKAQKALAFLVYFLCAALLCAMLNITLSVGDELAKQLRSYGSNIVVLPKGANLSVEFGDEIYEPLKDKNYLLESDLHLIKEIFWRNNITAFAPFLEGKISFKSENSNSTRELFLLGTYFEKALKIEDEEDFKTGIKSLYPYLQIEGKWPNDELSNEVLIGDELARELNLKIGENIFLNEMKIQISGILFNADKLSNKIITPLKLAQILFQKPGLYSRAEVSALSIPENDLALKARREGEKSLTQLEFDSWYCTAYIGSIAYQIEEDLKGASAKPLSAISDAESLVVRKIQTLMSLSCVICLIVASLAISSLMSAQIHRRKKEIALLKVLGASVFEIYLLFSCENFIISLFGALFGFVFGLGICELISINIFGYFLAPNFIILPLCIVFATFIALLGCLLGVRNISNLAPAEVLCGR